MSAKTGFGVNEAFSRLITEVYKFQTLEFAIEENIRNPNKKKGAGMAVSTTTIGGSSAHKNSLTLQPALHTQNLETDDSRLSINEQETKKDCKC